jgi:CBS domain containing-hemolysin-like protein
VGLNALFVAAEFAFVRIRGTQIDRLVEEGKATAGMVKAAREKLDAYLAVCQLGITISSLGLGALAEPVIDDVLVRPALGAFGLPESISHAIAFPLAFGIVSFMHVVFGELAPKTVAIQSPEATSLFVAPFMKFFYYLLFPGIVLFNGTANAFTRMFGYPPASESDEIHSEEEIRQLVAQSTRSGILEEVEENMLEGVFELEDTIAREIMVPRPDVVSLPAGMPLKDLVTTVAAGHYTRYPVYEEESPDRVLGAVHVKDVLRAVESGGSIEGDVTARELVRNVLVVPENKPLDDLLSDFQKQEIQMAIVIDEWGSFEGLITIEDILEEIVGEIRDEFDEEEPAVRRLSDGSYAIDGRIPIAVVNDALETDFESEDFDTIGGLILGQLGRPPEVGDEVRLDSHVLRVDETDGPRVAQVVVRQAPVEGADSEKEER